MAYAFYNVSIAFYNKFNASKCDSLFALKLLSRVCKYSYSDAI